LGVKAIEQGFSVKYYRFDELLTQLRRDADLPPSKLRRKKYLSTMLLIVDELGFEPMDRHEAGLFFRLVTYRYGHGHPGSPTSSCSRDQHQRAKLPAPRTGREPHLREITTPTTRHQLADVRKDICRLSA
jgi:DNA replication protein DnaC